MKKSHLLVLLMLCCHKLAAVRYQSICVTSGFEAQCAKLALETEEIRCVRVQDSIECANLLKNGSSGFGIFSAESTLLLAAMHYDGLTVLKELRHRDRLNYTSDFESVVIVKANHKNGIAGLNRLNYCHPGLSYDHAERWSERFLKHFERTVTIPDCSNTSMSLAEIEVAAIANFFNAACRPGAWSHIPNEDMMLKAKYPQLCELCSSKTSPCEYASNQRHTEALRCLINKGHAAYASLQDTQDFFSPLSEYFHLKSDYAYLCPDGTVQLLNDYTKNPCTWLRQPWSVIISSGTNNIELSDNINRWAYSTYNYENNIREILTADSLVPVKTAIQRPRDFFYPYRGIPYSQSLCPLATEVSYVKWCTKSLEEKEKCESIRAAGITTHVYPMIECQKPVADTITCLKEVREGRADFTGIDSNFGYIARHVYNLTTALYGVTDKQALATIVVHANSKFKKISDLRNAKACIDEFNGIASVAFLNAAKHLDLVPKKCNHSRLLAELFSSSCVPGASDPAHGAHGIYDNLCSLCPQTGSGAVSAVHTREQELNRSVTFGVYNKNNLQSELDVLNTETKLNCNAEQKNSFYGNRGALFCLRNKGDVAILGLRDLIENAKALQINPNNFQIICRNGSLADRVGFEVEPECALATFVDSEFVIKPQNPKREDIINALISFDKYFRTDPDIKMYATFDGHTNLLFNNATLGLSPYYEQDVDPYNNLLIDIEGCGGAPKFVSVLSINFAFALFSAIVNRLRH